jgi:hypothetical protein
MLGVAEGAVRVTDVAFRGEVIEWRGPAPFHFVAVPDALYGKVREAARLASYGWGCVPVSATVEGHDFTTSLIPRDGTYLVPLKKAVRATTGVGLGDAVAIRLHIAE